MLRGRHTITLCLACMAMLLALPGSAAAAIGIASFSLGTSTAQAGTHPDLDVDFAFEEPGEPETAQSASVELPRGFFFYPGLMVRCTANQFAASECPIASQVGVVTIHGDHEGNPDFELGMAPVYLMPPGSGEFAHLGFAVPTIEAPVDVPVVVGAATDYSPVLLFEGLPESTAIASVDFELWGVPAAPAHDSLRFPIVPGGRPSNVPQLPFTRNPTACGETSAALDAGSYEDPGNSSTTTASGPSIVECENLGLLYSPNVSLSSTEAATAAGLEVELNEFQDLTPTGLSSPDLESASIFLNGLKVNDAVVSTSSTCTLTQAHLDDDSPVECPVGSKIGTLTATVAGIEDPLEGSVYLGAAESPSEYEIFLVATGSGIALKVPARLDSGIEIPKIPQLPLEELDVRLGFSTPLLLTPPECGTYYIAGLINDWSHSLLSLILDGEYTIDSGPGGGPCPGLGGNEPSGSTPPQPPIPAPPTPAPLPAPRPVLKLLQHPPHHSHDRTPTFRFISTVAGSTFMCRLDNHPWHPCRSPVTLGKLPFGSHAFRIRALGPGGIKSAPMTYQFAIKPYSPRS